MAEQDQSSKPQSGFEGEKMLKLKAKSFLTVRGETHQIGDEFELPEREALSLVGTGAAEELPGTAAAKQE